MLLGSSIGSLILLSVPLVLMSALNPILISIMKLKNNQSKDSHSGFVFFISTLGSVFGVIFTALIIVPNFTNFSSYILSSTGMLFLARSLKLDYIASFLAAMIFAFSEARYGASGYIHLLTIQWMPFTLLFIHKYFDNGKRVFLYGAFLFYLIQITASAYHAILF